MYKHLEIGVILLILRIFPDIYIYIYIYIYIHIYIYLKGNILKNLFMERKGHFNIMDNHNLFKVATKYYIIYRS